VQGSRSSEHLAQSYVPDGSSSRTRPRRLPSGSPARACMLCLPGDRPSSFLTSSAHQVCASHTPVQAPNAHVFAERWRAVHNGMFDERTLAVLCAEQVADVIVGVNFARDNAEQETIRRIRQCMAARRRAVGLDGRRTGEDGGSCRGPSECDRDNADRWLLRIAERPRRLARLASGSRFTRGRVPHPAACARLREGSAGIPLPERLGPTPCRAAPSTSVKRRLARTRIGVVAS
jgi:hypothetical protein